ncbi:Uncharacterized protein ChrSV_0940 [Chromobacterium vaccinii]|nr:Uncharacterized protein ChrSW_0940 [Chromobacterium vaccinii]QND88399.1 Uncharacterized protein ChrSV_0940 [Chromobacterium vaccinii]
MQGRISCHLNDDGQQPSRSGARAPDISGGSCPHSRVGPVLCKSRLPGRRTASARTPKRSRGCRSSRFRLGVEEIMMLHPCLAATPNLVRHADPNFGCADCNVM